MEDIVTAPVVPAGEVPAVAPVTPEIPAVERDGGVQKRIGELTREKREAREEAAYWRGQAEARTTLVVPENTSEAAGAQDLDPNDFNSDADYLRAIATQTKDEIKAEAKAEKERKKAADAAMIITKQYQDARTKHPDFDDIALNPAIPITNHMFEAATGDYLGDVLYHLGKNPAEASRIATLSPTQQIKEIGKIETKLVATSAPKQTNTPNPPKILSGNRSSPSSKPEAEMSRAELHAKWNVDRGLGV